MVRHMLMATNMIHVQYNTSVEVLAGRVLMFFFRLSDAVNVSEALPNSGVSLPRCVDATVCSRTVQNSAETQCNILRLYMQYVLLGGLAWLRML